MRRREFITLVGCAAITWPLAARATEGADLVVDGVPLPPDAILTPVPKSGADFQRRWCGVWAGAWNGSLKHILIVERVGEDGTAAIVYAEADNPYTEVQARWWRWDAVVSGHTLTVMEPLFTATYGMDNDGHLEAVRAAAGWLMRR